MGIPSSVLSTRREAPLQSTRGHRSRRSASAALQPSALAGQRNPLLGATDAIVERGGSSQQRWRARSAVDPPPRASAVAQTHASVPAARRESPRGPTTSPPNGEQRLSVSWGSPRPPKPELLPDAVMQLAPVLPDDTDNFVERTNAVEKAMVSSTMNKTTSAPGVTVSSSQVTVSVVEGRSTPVTTAPTAAGRRTSIVSFRGVAATHNEDSAAFPAESPQTSAVDADARVVDDPGASDADEALPSARSVKNSLRRGRYRNPAPYPQSSAPRKAEAAETADDMVEAAPANSNSEGPTVRTSRRSSTTPVPEVAGDCNDAYALLASQQMAQAAQEMEIYMFNIRTVLRCWEIVSERYEAVVEDLAAVLATEHPEYAHLFLTNSLSAQARVMLNMIGEALVIVARPDEMFSSLLEVGALHRRYKVGEEHFLALQSAFMRLLPKYLPEDMQKTYEAAWTPLWKVVVQLLVHGRASARGDWHAAEQQKVFFAESRTAMAVIAAAQAKPAERGSFMTRLLEVSVAADPSMERFALLRDRRTSIRGFDGIVQILEGSEDTEATVLRMEQLSLDHVAYGLDVSSMRAFRQPFIETCGLKLRKANRSDLWTPQTRRSLGAFWDFVTATWATGFEHTQKSREAQAERAPSGKEPFCLMFTDIEASTRLWEHNPAAMGEAVEAHHRIVRSAISHHGAYEVKTVGDSFVIAAKDALIALKIALAIQLELMRGPIAPGFEMVDNAQGGGAAECWRSDSLRVRVGIHYCHDASAVYDNVQRRYDYYGPGVNCTARTESAASGGQILMTEDALDALQRIPEYTAAAAVSGADGCGRAASIDKAAAAAAVTAPKTPSVADTVTVEDWGAHAFKGIERRIQLFSILPQSLAGRSFNRCPTSISSTSLSSTLGSASMHPRTALGTSTSVSMCDSYLTLKLR
ncbi:Adenylate and Guanylate cyclase catalytic domain containing protein [Novymonas esmeraldas]|uniref:Adenylate and Guanylate cyclase catalytic domain containing protein n=1 Tax=Novymonas esmeraldas TaxID=1808958 RepID=A0AAW0F1Q1_9TRYP